MSTVSARLHKMIDKKDPNSIKAQLNHDQLVKRTRQPFSV